MKQTIFASLFILALCLFSFHAFAQEVDYSGDSGYQQFVQCSSWIDENRSNNASIDRRNERIEDLESRIDSYDSDIATYRGQQSNTETWMSIQEAAQDWDGYNRSVDQFNNALENEERVHRKRNSLVDDLDDVIDNNNDTVDENEELIATAKRYCVGKYWSQEIIDRACSTYNSDTATFCEGFEQ